MRLTICGIKLSSNGLHVCVAAEIWESPKSNQAGRGITLEGPAGMWLIKKKNQKQKSTLDSNQLY